jgi:hypothetical protein
MGRVHESWINSEKRALLPYLREVQRVSSGYVFQQLTPTTQKRFTTEMVGVFKIAIMYCP